MKVCIVYDGVYHELDRYLDGYIVKVIISQTELEQFKIENRNNFRYLIIDTNDQLPLYKILDKGRISDKIK